MQTFLPYEDFVESAKVLDNKRLGKQRVEVLQILNALSGKSRGWVNHPATRMWRGHELALAVYGVKVCDEWTSRGFNDTCRSKIVATMPMYYGFRGPMLPDWLGDRSFHRSHQSNLLRKDPAFYGPYFMGVPNDLPYVWPC
jgi:hypothetical protein